uniref:SMP-LTD domain-containing protein n=1 Tax=Knipowitschia caucasica TaxID=637954 RepID=A0AAV2KFP0_KNICA
MELNLNRGHTSQALTLPHSPSSPGSLADLCSACESPTTYIVKSSSSELKRKDDSPLKGKQPLSLPEEGILEGWMNETYIYDAETFHPSASHSVYVSLVGSRLQLSVPSSNIPRWASLNKPPPEPDAFEHSRVFQLTDCKVSLLPSGLARKRIWNKKYPICIDLCPGEGDVQEQGKTSSLYLFGRTGRDKEEWFQHFISASKPETTSSERDEGKSNAACVGETVQEACEELVDLTGAMKTRTLMDYSTYMAQLIDAESHEAISSPKEKEVPLVSKNNEIVDTDSTHGVLPGEEVAADVGTPGISGEEQCHWINSLVGRIFWDFLREKYWTDQVSHKIQKKLSKIKLPYFMNELKLAALDMGTCLPQVISTSKPALDHRGLWLEMDVTYSGCLHMTLETKMDLCKLGKDGEVQTESIQESPQLSSKPRQSILADSDEESSSAGSSDEEDVFEPLGPPGEKSTVVVPDGGNSTGRKFLQFVDKIAKSKYFQKATENEYIKKKIAEVSKMPLMLSVEVQELSGTLAINVPPPPTDRIWYSFRVPPQLDLHVRPMLGEMEVTFTHVTEWIEKKLQCEFQKVFVMPNMDDLYLPLMTSGLDTHSGAPVSQHSSVASSQQSSVESQDYLSE